MHARRPRRALRARPAVTRRARSAAGCACGARDSGDSMRPCSMHHLPRAHARTVSEGAPHKVLTWARHMRSRTM